MYLTHLSSTACPCMTTVMVRPLVSQPILSVEEFSRYRSERSGNSGFVAMTTLLTRSSVSTGYECRKGSCSRSPCRHTGRCRLMLRSIFGSSPPSPTRRPDKDSDLHPPIICLFLLSDFTVGRRAFPVAGARIWNDLPSDVTSSPALFTFKRRLKCTYFAFPTLI